MSLLRYVQVDLKNIANNIKSFRKLLGKEVAIMVVVKSNAYGHGILEVSKTVLKSGANYLAVVNMEEALFLRQNGIKANILVLGFVAEEMLAEVINHDITIGLYNYEMAKKASAEALKQKKDIKIHLKIDTGLNRLGVLPDQALMTIEKMCKLKGLNIEGMFTHFSDAENPASWQTEDQIGKFNKIISNLKKKKIKMDYYHAGASAASILIPKTRLNMVRIGIATYGMWPSLETMEAASVLKNLKGFRLKSAFAYKTILVEKKKIKAGSLVGYGGNYRLRKDSYIGVIPVGYAEGYDRKLSNNSEVLIGGKKVKVLGNICMNMTIIDLNNCSKAKIGDEVVLIGKQGSAEITAKDLAQHIGTINYEVTTRIPSDIPRKYI